MAILVNVVMFFASVMPITVIEIAFTFTKMAIKVFKMFVLKTSILNTLIDFQFFL